ncbi:hypothetical protein FRC10_008379 [Ceratobasidium sp. 414]|nr:hypothetical protein FRC10_008379 [Ceratobasidium sp. 414]
MFPFGHNPYAPLYQSYDTYGQQLTLEELQRRGEASERAHRMRLEEMSSRAAQAEAEHARRMEELQRETDKIRRRGVELAAQMKKLNLSGDPLAGLRIGDLGSPYSMFGGGVHDLFNTFHGCPLPQSPPIPATGRSSMPSAPKATRERSPFVEPKPKARFAAKDGAAPNAEKPVANGPTSKTTPAIFTSAAKDAANATEIQQVDTSPSRKAVADILSKFSSLKSSFILPTTLDFLPSPEGVSTSTPKLAYTPNNAPLHQYEHLLTSLLTQLDAVESYGDMGVRKARRGAVRKIEKELEELDGKKVHKWRGQLEKATNEAAVAEPIFPDADVTQATSFTGEIAPQLLLSVDPASIPLPHGHDQELQIDDTPEPPAPTTSSEPAALDVPTQQQLPAHYEFTKQVVPPASSSPSPLDAEPTQVTPMQEPHADIPASKASVIEYDTVEDDYVSVPSAEKIGNVAHPEVEGLEENHIMDDWELNF